MILIPSDHPLRPWLDLVNTALNDPVAKSLLEMTKWTESNPTTTFKELNDASR